MGKKNGTQEKKFNEHTETAKEFYSIRQFKYYVFETSIRHVGKIAPHPKFLV